MLAGYIPVSTDVGLTTKFLLPGNIPGLGEVGASAYEIAVEEDFVGTVDEWLESLVGPAGVSTYDIIVEEGFSGTEVDWILSLHGSNLKISGSFETLDELLSSTSPLVQDTTYTELTKLYIFTEGKWVDLGSHKGDVGPEGHKGYRGEPLELGSTKTNVTALWDGTEWILAVGASY